MEKELDIGMMVIDMKVNGEMIKEKEKEFIIGMMVIEEWVIIIIINQQESMLYLLKMEMLKQKIGNLN